MKIISSLLSLAIVGTLCAGAQNPDASLLNLLDNGAGPATAQTQSDDEPTLMLGFVDDDETPSDSTAEVIYFTPLRFMPVTSLPPIAFLPVVYDGLQHIDSTTLSDPSPYVASESEAIDFWRNLENQSRHYRQLKQTFMIYNMPLVRYNINTLPKPPKKYEAKVDPISHKITVVDIKSDVTQANADVPKMRDERRNWLKQFNANLQFSQAYVSRNWYQGGNSNVNLLGNMVWNVKLNTRFNPKYIFEATTQYKIGVTSSHNDTEHDFIISQDLFQFNSTAGIHAFRRWYYSFSTLFKTQLFNYYPANSSQLQSAFMSPGELNLGVGMTYSYNNAKRKFTLNASFAPISYNLKTCINREIDPTAFGLKEHHNTKHSFGSNVEARMTWQIAWNISYQSRLFMFTNYDYGQADWENTLNFSVNKYLSTQLFWHLRYDSSQPSRGGWHKWQFKEVLSFGLQYQFKSY